MRHHKLTPYYIHKPQPRLQEIDLELAQKVMGGDMNAWEILRNGTYDKVLRIAERKGMADNLLSFDDCIDIVEDAFYRCYLKIHTFRGESRFSTWVGGYVKNIAFNYRSRKLTQIRNRTILATIIYSKNRNFDPLNLLIEYEVKTALWQAFYSLNLNHQTIIGLHVLHGINFLKIGKRIGLSRKEVSKEYSVAITILRQKYLKFYLRRE